MICNTVSLIFPECVARVPVSLRGCGGRAVFARRCVYVRNRSQPSARGPFGRAYGKFCKRCPFSSFPASRSVVSRGRRCTLWHASMFHDVSKVVLCGRGNTFSEDALHFSWQAQHFGHLRCHFAWQAQHFRRVVLRVSANRMSALREVVTPHHSTVYTLHSTLDTPHFTL